MTQQLSSILVVCALLFVGVAIFVEKNENPTWNNRLLWPSFTTSENKHTPRFANGIFLPPRIEKDTTYDASKGPLILAHTVTVEPNVTLTFAPETRVFALEHASLIVEGSINSKGTAEKPVLFTTNELHPENQTWNGLTITPTGKVSATYTTIEFASPGITCDIGSRASLSHITIDGASTGVFTKSDSCSISDSILKRVRDGVIGVGVTPNIQNTTIHATHMETHTY